MKLTGYECSNQYGDYQVYIEYFFLSLKLQRVTYPQLVSMCWTVQGTTVHKYRTLTTLLCKVYLSRHPQPHLYCHPFVFMVWILQWGVKVCWNIHNVSYVSNSLLSYSDFKYGGEQPIALLKCVRKQSSYYCVNSLQAFQPFITLHQVLIYDVSLINCSV
jgi:hypothetical protein